MREKLIQAINIMKQSRSLFVLTGAGVSAESGIPTFRGKDGLWKNYSATDLATPEAFAKNPGLVWEWYHWRQEIILRAQPNPAHIAIVQLERIMEKFLLLTQNVDNLHKRAGSQNILELHGNIFRTRCLSCAKVQNYSPDNTTNRSPVPMCACGGVLRPDVVWFGEAIPHYEWAESLAFLDNADVVIICGTSGAVWPAASLPTLAMRNKIKTIEINPVRTPISDAVDVFLPGKAGVVLPDVVERTSAL
jgi:NAD-dependent deacetylase